jgi:heterodisulfide reductase subunit A-like polyferredoxin
MGGMMSLGVPAYRLPSEVIERDIQNILDYGVDVQLNSPIDTEEQIEDFLEDGFESVFLSVGSHISATMRMKGEELDKVSHGIDFLRDVRLGNKTEVQANTIVIGGGNVAMDCARTAIRLGAQKVSLVCLEERDKMPAYPWEVEWAVEEGVEIHDASSTKTILDIDGKFVGLELLEVEKMEFVDGRLDLKTVYASESILSGRELIVAIGQRPDLEFRDEESRIEVTPRGTIAVDEKTSMTSMPGVFAGGDAVRGAASVVQATADGQKAAKAIDAYIKGTEFIPEVDDSPVVEITAAELKERKEKKIQRIEMGVIDLDKRMNTFDEVDVGFTEEQVKAEASRCLYCAICCYCKQCEKVCEAGAICFDDKPKNLSLNVGAVILAPGFDLYDARKKGEYGYGRFDNVVSSMDYERIVCASGPFDGHIQRLSDGKAPKKIAFIQCVGSRDSENPYCSSVCCMYATKQAIITKEHLPDVECKVFVMDVRAFGKDFDEYYERAKNKYGVEYIYTRPSSVMQNFKTGDLSIQFTANGKDWVEEDFDMVVLGSGLCASESAKKLVKVCDIEVNEYNFALSSKFAQTLSSREGVYLAGAFESPKDIPESVTQGSAAAAKAMELLADVRGTEVAVKTYPDEKETEGLEPRIGVFVCHCGSNIGAVIDCEKVAGIAAKLDKVVFATDLLYTCSPDGLLVIREKIEEHNLNRVVIASCTPRTHEPLFRENLKEAGLNPYLFEMANIRDQCTWVHANLGSFTENKAIDLIAMSVGRAREIEALSSQTYIPNRSGLIVGGGVSGMTAALSIADQGFDVYLVEKTYRLGGESVNIKSTVEGYDPMKLVKGLEDRVVAHDKITVYTH